MARRNSYRGRNRGRNPLHVIIVVLLFLLIFCVVGFFFLDPYIVYTDNGIRLDLTFFDEGGTTAPAASSNPVAVVEATPEPTLEPTPEPQTFRAITLTQADLLAGDVLDQVAEAGATAAIFDMKGDDGLLGYVSSLSMAASLGTSANNTALNEAITSLNKQDVYTVARISCYRDNLAPYNSNAMALRTTTGNWWDNESNRWLSPAVTEVSDYLAGICRELAALGFDEILLDNCAYPTEGNGEIETLTNYPVEERAAQVEGLYAAVHSALADYPATMLSLVVSEDAFLTEGNVSGQTVEQLVHYGERVWMDATQGESATYEELLTQAGMDSADHRIVLLTDALPTQQYGCWAVLN